MISIHIVSYNKPRFAINTVQSILNQKLGFGKYEIFVLECGDWVTHAPVINEYLDKLLLNESDSIFWFGNVGNLGLAGGLNYLHLQQTRSVDYIVEMNEDMLFAPFAIENMVAALESDPKIGLACANLVNGGLGYDRHNPKPEDVDDFAKRYTDKEPSKLNYNGSNLPYAIRESFYQELASFDVWNDAALPFNTYDGIWDESIDPYKVGWYADWDIYQRVIGLGKEKVIVENAHCYHYDHCSGADLDAALPTWTVIPKQNFILKYGSEEKVTEWVRRAKPPQYPLKAVGALP